MNTCAESNLVRKILIVRPSAIGDLVMASPMLAVLRAAYPEARLSWLIEPQIKDVLATNRFLDQLIDWPKAEWSRLWQERRYLALGQEIREFRNRLRRERFDLVLDAQGLLRSRMLAWLSAGTNRVGFSSKEPGGFLMTRIISRGPDSNRMSSEYRHMMQELGLETGAFHPCLDVSEEHQREATKILAGCGVDGPYVVLAPFTTRPQKHWFGDRWAELAERVGRAWGVALVVLGGPGDREAGQKIVEQSGGQAVNAAGLTRLGVSMAAIKGARLLIGVDTGLTHMGPAFDRPTIALFGATCPYLKTSRDNTTVLYHERSCSPCKRSPTCEGRFDCMADITVEEVFATASVYLDGAR